MLAAEEVRVLRPRPAARRAPCDGSPSARRARWRVAHSGRSVFRGWDRSSLTAAEYAELEGSGTGDASRHIVTGTTGMIAVRLANDDAIKSVPAAHPAPPARGHRRRHRRRVRAAQRPRSSRRYGATRPSGCSRATIWAPRSSSPSRGGSGVEPAVGGLGPGGPEQGVERCSSGVVDGFGSCLRRDAAMGELVHHERALTDRGFVGRRVAASRRSPAGSPRSRPARGPAPSSGSRRGRTASP